MTTNTNPTINHLYENFRAGRSSRRRFIEAATATAAGATVAAATFLANGGNAFAAQSSPAASPQTSPAAGVPTRPEFGTGNQTRGQGDQLRIIWWQAATTLAPHPAGDSASNLIFEPLLTYFPDGSIQPVLLEATPSVENGLLAADLSSVTLKLQPACSRRPIVVTSEQTFT